MTRKRVIVLALVLFLFLLVAIYLWFSAALSPYAACRSVMLNVEGYGPWRFQSTVPPSVTHESRVTVTFNDGFNTASCSTERYGPLWIVTGVGQTAVGCGRDLKMGADCPRGKFGVVP